MSGVSNTQSASDRPPLSLGLVVEAGRQSASLWQGAVRRVENELHELRHSIDTPLRLNVIFIVPGGSMGPDFEGIRTGRYSEPSRLLVIQVAAIEDPTNSLETEILANVEQAIDLAEAFARRKHISATSLESLRQLVAQAKERLNRS